MSKKFPQKELFSSIVSKKCRLRKSNDYAIKIFINQNRVAPKIVNETSLIHYGPHDKDVELAEIYRLCYSKWGGR